MLIIMTEGLDNSRTRERCVHAFPCITRTVVHYMQGSFLQAAALHTFKQMKTGSILSLKNKK